MSASNSSKKVSIVFSAFFQKIESLMENKRKKRKLFSERTTKYPGDKTFDYTVGAAKCVHFGALKELVTLTER